MSGRDDGVGEVMDVEDGADLEWAEIKAEVMIGGKGEYKASQKAG